MHIYIYINHLLSDIISTLARYLFPVKLLPYKLDKHVRIKQQNYARKLWRSFCLKRASVFGEIHMMRGVWYTSKQKRTATAIVVFVSFVVKRLVICHGNSRFVILCREPQRAGSCNAQSGRWYTRREQCYRFQ